MSKWKVKYYSGDGIIEITVRDETGAKEDFYRCNMLDKKAQKKIGRLLKQKYDVDLTPPKMVEGDTGFFDY
jgi:hypothetical protein